MYNIDIRQDKFFFYRQMFNQIVSVFQSNCFRTLQAGRQAGRQAGKAEEMGWMG
jgi:hypothetical protein